MSARTPIRPRQLERLTSVFDATPAPSVECSPGPSRSATPVDGKGESLKWTKDMLHVLLKALVHKVVEDGMRADSGYKKQAWVYARDEVQKLVDDKVVLDKHCKHKHDACKKDWKIWCELSKLSGFAVDVEGVIVGDSHALAEYFDKHKEARKFKSRPLEFEELHRQLFEGVLATGDDALGLDELLRGTKGSTVGIQYRYRDPSQAPYEGEGVNETSRRKRAGTQSVGGALRVGKKATGEKLSSQIANISDQIGALVATMRHDDQREAIETFMSTYRALDDHLKFAILDEFADKYRAKIFVSLTPEGTRKEWIKRQLVSRHERQQIERFEEYIEAVEWEGDGDLEPRARQTSTPRQLSPVLAFPDGELD